MDLRYHFCDLPRYGLSDFASINALKRLSKSRWAALVQKHVKNIDLSELKASMLLRGTAASRFSSEINCTEVQNSYIWHFDRTSTLYKFYPRSHSFGLLLRIIHTDNETGQTIAVLNLGVDNQKLCKCCMSTTKEEDEVHLMINRAAYAVVRMEMWHNLNVSLTTAGFHAMPYDVTAVGSRAAGLRTVATWVRSG
jgi:hypothetical protein